MHAARNQQANQFSFRSKQSPEPSVPLQGQVKTLTGSSTTANVPAEPVVTVSP